MIHLVEPNQKEEMKNSKDQTNKSYSGKQVIRAGEKLLNDEILQNQKEFEQAMDVLSYWRYSHESPLSEAVNAVEKTIFAIDNTAIIAKRLKRYVSIVNKLRRFRDMKLKNMQDIGGCRVIVSTPKKLKQSIRALRKRPEFKTRNGKLRFKDYLETPKEDGYRGYHLIGQFIGDNKESRCIEVQLRTNLQHDWATALEIVDLFTGQRLKANQGEGNWMDFFREVSAQFAIMESIHLFNKNNKEHHDEYFKKAIETDKAHNSLVQTQSLAHSLNVVRKFEAYAQSLKVVDTRLQDNSIDGFALVEVNTAASSVTSTLFHKENSSQAEAEYIAAEKRAAKQKGLVVALVSTTAIGGIKEAYPNYFADSTDFLKHLLIITDHNQPKKTGFFSKIFG